MIQGIHSADEYLYHYTTAGTARAYILKDATIRLGSYTTTNDPKETKQWEFGLGTNSNRDLAKYNHSELSRWLSDELKRRTRLACFATDTGPLTGDHMSDLLRRGFAKPRMWAQYAANHTGVCLVFLKSNLLAVAKQELESHYWMTGSVQYRNHDVVRGIDAHEYMLNVDIYDALGPEAYASAHAKQFHGALYFEKLEDWRDECEWRILALANSPAEIFLPIRQCLAGVMHGDATDPDLSEELMRLTHGWNGVEHMGLSWKNSAPWYDYGSFGWSPGKVTKPRRRA